MPNIRVDSPRTIADGMELKFRSPVDCSQVTGLIVYYPSQGSIETSKEFLFADAHGNNVGHIDHLFAENVVVKVILDVVNSMAYVQNADTNAYIERTFIKTVNGVAPDKNGNVNVATAPGDSQGASSLRVTLTTLGYDESSECFVCEVDKTAEEITAALESGMCVTAVYTLTTGDGVTFPIDIPYTTYMDDSEDPIIIFSKSVTLAADTLFVSVLYIPLMGAAMVYVTENTGAANLTRAEEVSF